MSKRYSGKSFKDSSVMKKAKLSFKEKRKIKREKKKNKNQMGGVLLQGAPDPKKIYKFLIKIAAKITNAISNPPTITTPFNKQIIH